ncbi:MAG: hypothetical protein NVS3B21_30630 [Acidimicrobiales bacterium]
MTDDSWEPGAPSARAMAPGLVGGAVVPLAVYYAVRSHVGGDAPALMIAGIPATAWVGIEWVRKRRVDPIGCIVLFGFIGGVLASVALGGSAFVLKVRDSGFTFLFGATCLTSLLSKRPMMYFIGRALSAGDDADKIAAYEELWTMPSAPRTFRIITATWGIGLIAEAAARVGLALTVSTGPFLALSHVLGAITIGALFVFTVRFSKRARRLGEVEFAALGVVYPSLSTGPGPQPSATQG